MPQITAAIQQLNLSYNQLEDRLLLKVGMDDKSELAMWITRRICKELWHLLQDTHEQMLEGSKATAEFDTVSADDFAGQGIESVSLPAPRLAKKSSADSISVAQETALLQQNMDFSQTYVADRKSLTQAPFLVTECLVQKSTDDTTTLAFKANAGELVTMGLTLELIVALSNMMQLSTKEANWDLLMLQSHATKHLMPSSEVIH